MAGGSKGRERGEERKLRRSISVQHSVKTRHRIRIQDTAISKKRERGRESAASESVHTSEERRKAYPEHEIMILFDDSIENVLISERRGQQGR